MFKLANNLIGNALHATDGEIGQVKDLLFDDRAWRVRYLVLDTGRWLPGRKVLLTPGDVTASDGDADTLSVAFDKEKVENSPELAEHEPVSRQKEKDLALYYGWTPYWASPVGYYPNPVPPVGGLPQDPGAPGSGDGTEPDEPDLRSVDEVEGYHLHATDGEIGHLEDFVLDPDGWLLRYLVVDTRNWLPGKRVLVSPGWVRDIAWSEREVVVDHTRDEIESAPAFDTEAVLDRDYEQRLYDYYGRLAYWDQ
jgi:uncharacterized protein YrrD